MRISALKSLTTSAAFLVLLAASGNAARATELVSNGSFATGTLADWTLVTTANGSLGHSPYPDVTSFNVTGTGATNAAKFQVGQLNFAGYGSTPAGGGISQSITTTAGSLDFSADIAAYNSNSVGSNAQAGIFSVVLDGVTEDTVSLGSIPSGQTFRGTLSFDTTVSAGPQTLEILMTRPYTNTLEGDTSPLDATPFQYVTGISATQASVSPVPLPGALPMFGCAIAGLGMVGARSRSRKSLES